jgi:hypothetical protein
MLTSLGIGEALVTVLDERGIPTPLAATLLAAPRSRMGPLEPGELKSVLERSALSAKYNQRVDPVSAYEMLGGKVAAAASAHRSAPARPAYTPSGSARPAYRPAEPAAAPAPNPPAEGPLNLPYPEPPTAKGPSVFDGLMKGVGNQVLKQIGRSAASTVTRELLGVLGLGSRARRR